MTEQKDDQQESGIACMKCGADSSDRLLLPVKYQDQDQWVCSRCLPFFIHGAH